MKPAFRCLLLAWAVGLGPSAAAEPVPGQAAWTGCTARSVQTVHGYVRDLMPRLAGVLISSTLVEDALSKLQDAAGYQAAWKSASAETRGQVVTALSREAYALRDQVRQQVTARFAELPWSTALKLDCAGYDRLARRMSMVDAKSYFELERMTLDEALSLAAQGVPSWLDLASDAERTAARADAVALARSILVYPFNLEGRAAFNALAVQGLQHSSDARTAAWMSEVRRVMSGPTASRFHKTDEAGELHGIITGGVNDVVRNAYDAASRATLKAEFERHLAIGLKPLDTVSVP